MTAHSPTPSEYILLVDDEPNVTAAIRRTFFDEFVMDTAESGEEALQMLQSQGPYAVIVSDMRMPGMDGATLLAHTKRLAPDTVRVLLTGQASLESAIAAVNQGNIFRFLCKPCADDELRQALRDGLRQHQLVCAEQELLEGTLQGAVGVLSEVLSLALPTAFEQATGVRTCVEHVIQEAKLKNTWELSLAAMLSHVGLIATPPETLAAHVAGKALPPDERALVRQHREVAYNLLRQIPRMAGVAAIVRGHHAEAGLNRVSATYERDVQVLNAALAFQAGLDRGATAQQAASAAIATCPEAAPWREALASFGALADAPNWRVVDLTISALLPGMKTECDVLSPTGAILVPKGRDLTQPLIARLRGFAASRSVVQPVRVRAPTEEH